MADLESGAAPPPGAQARTPAAEPPDRPGALAAAGFLGCAAVAVGYGLWALYGSGAVVATLDAAGTVAASAAPMAADPPAVALGPVLLDPAMNPLRAVLRTAHAPVGSTRIRYRIELVDARGGRIWAREGAVGSRDDEASVMWTTGSLATFAVAGAGEHVVRVWFAGGSMDDLRQATIELRRNVVPVDPRVPWGFGLAAGSLLVVTLVRRRRRPWPGHPGERRAAA